MHSYSSPDFGSNFKFLVKAFDLLTRILEGLRLLYHKYNGAAETGIGTNASIDKNVEGGVLRILAKDNLLFGTLTWQEMIN